MFGLGGFELAIIAGIVVLLFGNRLPGAARSLGQSFSAFKKGIKEGSEDEEGGGGDEKLEPRSYSTHSS